MGHKKTIFSVSADDKAAIEEAIKGMNIQSKSDYELFEFKEGTENNCKIAVSEDKIIPEYLFMMGIRYEGYKSFNEKSDDY